MMSQCWRFQLSFCLITPCSMAGRN